MSIQKLATRGLSADVQLQRVVESVNALIDGKADVAGTFTLTPSAGSTVVLDNKFESNMVPVFVPISGNAAAALPSSYVSDRSKGSFTITHANNAQADRSFLYVRFG